jgi:hypothetical protein
MRIQPAAQVQNDFLSDVVGEESVDERKSCPEDCNPNPDKADRCQ